MFKYIFIVLIGLIVGVVLTSTITGNSISGAPPYAEAEENVPRDPLTWLNNWVRPSGPARVGIQIGHLNSNELPDELEKLRGNSGASSGEYTEVQINESIAMELKALLEQQGVEVDILPATVPHQYYADVFIALHADGSLDPETNGYKFASSWRDVTGDAERLVSLLNSSYKEETKLSYDPNITKNMRGYYAFSWWRYDHAIHPMTTAVIAEMGFVSNQSDRDLLTKTPQIPAQGLANGIMTYLKQEKLL